VPGLLTGRPAVPHLANGNNRQEDSWGTWSFEICVPVIYDEGFFFPRNRKVQAAESFYVFFGVLQKKKDTTKSMNGQVSRPSCREPCCDTKPLSASRRDSFIHTLYLRARDLVGFLSKFTVKSIV